jgi:hypothetical protein
MRLMVLLKRNILDTVFRRERVFVVCVHDVVLGNSGSVSEVYAAVIYLCTKQVFPLKNNKIVEILSYSMLLDVRKIIT